MCMRLLYLFIIILLAQVVVGQAPPNDNCIDAEVLINLDNNCDFRAFRHATFDFMSARCGSDSLANIWYKFTAQGTAIEIEAELSDGRDVFLQVFEFLGPPCDSSSVLILACDTNRLVKGSILQLGMEYYISASADTGVLSDMILCVSNPLINHDPINDYICNATSVAIDSSCRSGTLENATYDFPNPACPNADERSVWFKGTLPPSANAIEIIFDPLNLDTLAYEVGVFRLQNGTSCVDPPNYLGGICGNGRDTFKVYGLIPGNSYHIMVSSKQSDLSTFNICFRPVIPPPGCALNDICRKAEEIPIEVDFPMVCVDGCNTGASVGPFDTSYYCTEFPYPSVFYKVYVDSSMDIIEARLSGGDFDKPQLAVFYGDCDKLTYVICDYGADGTLDFSFKPPVRDTMYYFIVSDITGKTGNFNLCIDAISQEFECNYENRLEVLATSLGSPLEGPYKAGEEIYFRYTLEDWIPTNCNWLQGIVPVFISGWDPTSFTPMGEIRAIYSAPEAHREGEWKWYTSGSVHYNYNNPLKGYNAGDILSPGWFFLEENETSLDSSRGDGIGCIDSIGMVWAVEFSVRIVPYPGCVEDSVFNALIEFKTFSDGEIGDQKRPACNKDLTTIFSVPFVCCSGPILTGESDTICSGEIINYRVQNADSVNEYRWNVIPNSTVEGEFSTIGTHLSQRLVNKSGNPSAVRYTLYGRDTAGCYGPPAHYNVTVLPEITAHVGSDTLILCKNEFITLGDNPPVTGGVAPYVFIWNDQKLRGPHPDLVVNESRQIILQVRGAYNCADRDTMQLIARESPRAILPDVINLCRGDTQTIIIPLDGTPPFIYNMSFNGDYRGKDTTMENYLSFKLVGKEDITLKIDSLQDAICASKDSNITRVIIRDSIVENISATICGDEVYFIGNQGFNETGIYKVELPGASKYGCDSTVVLNLKVNELIVLSDTMLTYDAEADTGSISITVRGGVPPYSYLWSSGDTTSFINGAQSGLYVLIVTDSVDCSREFEINLKDPSSVVSIPTPEFALYPQPVKAGNSIYLTFKNLSYGTYAFELYSTKGELISSEKFLYGNRSPSFQKEMKYKGVFYWLIKQHGHIVLTGKCIVL